MPQPAAHPADPPFLAAPGEMGQLTRTHPWHESPLGPPAQWPQSLKTAVGICLHSRFPMLIWWGPDLVMLYNDAYRPMLGQRKHPAALGQSGEACWREIWPVIGPLLRDVLQSGRATWSADQMLVLERNGYPEECYFTFSYSPIHDESGGIGGVFTAVTETTERVVNERRMRTLNDLSETLAGLGDSGAICRAAAEAMGRNPDDLLFAGIYALDAPAGRAELLAASGSLPAGWGAAGVHLAAGSGDPLAHAMQRVLETGEPQDVELPPGSCAAGTRRAVVRPVRSGQRILPTALLVAGLNPMRTDDAGYRGFIAAASTHLGWALDSAQAHEVERQRTAALAQLDRAKTDFFSDISHELRTPLALMVGPLELLLQGRSDGGEMEVLRMAHRNALRLRELVNRLLDFSRIETGRMLPKLEPTDLAQATTEIAAMFRSAIEGAGLKLVVDCPPQPPVAWVDRGMWEKIVVNFLSNAFKYTEHGGIEVRLNQQDDCVVLQVRDTGCGIAAQHLPRLFDRFFRVEGAHGRTDEGAGIGLALVKELVQLHDGAIDVASEPGEGSVFTVVLPLVHGTDDRDTVPDAHDVRPWHESVHAGLDELERLSSSVAASAQLDLELPPGAAATCVLVVDENADMRSYVARLLAPRWQVQFASSGAQALAALRERLFDLVISDVSLPGPDGLDLVHSVRADPTLRAVPMLLLSAFSSEEARLDALAAGADDCLVKPFSARELVARVENQLMRARLHQIEGAVNRRLSRVFQQVPAAVALLAGPEHRFEFANPAYEKLVGRRVLRGRTVAEVFPELAGQGVFEMLDGVYRSGEPVRREALRIELRDEATGVLKERHFAFVYEPMPDPEGSVGGIAVVAYDVSALVAARRAAETATRTKDEFIAMLGHELRNPLAPIVTALHLMRLKNGEVAVRERAIIERQVQHMVALIDDLLDVARITRGTVQLKRVPLEMWGVVAKAVETAGPLIEQRRHELCLRVPSDGCKVQGDAVRLVQVVSNLLTNAAKFTDPGGRIVVETRRAGGRLHLCVTDTGSGMNREELASAFELFAQGQQSPDRPHGGLGLGLAIAQSLARLHDGDLRAESAGRGQGCCFTLELPLLADDAPTAQPAESAAAPHAQSERCVLVVDDNTDAADMLRALLEAWGHRACVAHDGAQALQVLQAERVDVALIDIGLPVMDGHELARRIRDEPAWMAMRLIALTGYGQDSDRQRSTDAGFDAHLVKPVDAALLARLLA
jgi:signal transduction histidine kinase/ActR/RegA family two-component response regulator